MSTLTVVRSFVVLKAMVDSDNRHDLVAWKAMVNRNVNIKN